jgi:uncharacterized protein DUF1837
MNGLHQFLTKQREPFTNGKTAVRRVYLSELNKNGKNGVRLSDYIADGTPLFYRDLSNIAEDMGDGYFLSPIKDTLRRLPTSEKFQESHFGEITAAIFAEETIGLRKIYSKLSLLTAENSNAYKIDLILFDPNSDPLTLFLAEVKSSPKVSVDGLAVGHDKSCFADIFNSMNSYDQSDLDFDLQAAKDRLNQLPVGERGRLRQALCPYASTPVKYAAFAVIDVTTKRDDEISVLATRKNEKIFDVDLICVDNYPSVASFVYSKLDRLRQNV